MSHRPPNDRETANLAFSIDDFFVCQNGTQLCAPVNRDISDISEANAVRSRATISRNRLGLIRLGVEPGIVNLKKNPLGPLIVARVGRIDFPLPIIRKANALQLRFKFCNIRTRRGRRVLSGFDRVLLRRQTKRVPTHRMQDIESTHPFVTRNDIGRGIAFGVSDV